MKKINNYIDTTVCTTDNKNVHLLFSVCHIIAYVKVSLITQNSLETIILIIIILNNL